MAATLVREHGIPATNIVILEKTNRIGGKSLTKFFRPDGSECSIPSATCIAHDMGTCFLHNGYRYINQLAKTYGLRPAVTAYV